MTYKDEIKELYDDITKKLNDLRVERDEAYEKGETKGLDSIFDKRQKELIKEQNERLLALKSKYSIG